MASKIIKTTTGLTGLAVSKNPHQALKVLYEKTLQVVHKMPENYAYRTHTHEVLSTNLEHVKKISSVEELERKLEYGQIEEAIVQAERELSLSRKMLEWKPWDSLLQPAPRNQWQWPL